MYVFMAKFGFLATPGLLPDVDYRSFAAIEAKGDSGDGAYITDGRYVEGDGYNYAVTGFVICDEIPAIGALVDFAAFESDTNPLTLEDLPGRCFLATGRLLEVENCIGEAVSLASYIAWYNGPVGAAGGEDGEDGIDLGGMMASLVARQKANIERVKATLSPAQTPGFEAGIAALGTGCPEIVEAAMAPLNATEKEGFEAALDFLQTALEAEDQAEEAMDEMREAEEYAREAAIMAQGDRLRVWHYLRHENLSPETAWNALVTRFHLDMRLLGLLPGNRGRIGFFTDGTEYAVMVFELALDVKPKHGDAINEDNWDISKSRPRQKQAKFRYTNNHPK